MDLIECKRYGINRHPWELSRVECVIKEVKKYHKGSKILDIVCWDLCWKSKWDSPRHEWDPHFRVVLFNTFEFRITWSYINDSGGNESMEYWESALNWIYFNKDLQSSVEDATGWQHLNLETNTWEDNIYNFLRKPYQQYYNDGNLNEIYYE